MAIASSSAALACLSASKINLLAPPRIYIKVFDSALDSNGLKANA